MKLLRSDKSISLYGTSALKGLHDLGVQLPVAVQVQWQLDGSLRSEARLYTKGHDTAEVTAKHRLIHISQKRFNALILEDALLDTSTNPHTITLCVLSPTWSLVEQLGLQHVVPAHLHDVADANSNQQLAACLREHLNALRANRRQVQRRPLQEDTTADNNDDVDEDGDSRDNEGSDGCDNGDQSSLPLRERLVLVRDKVLAQRRDEENIQLCQLQWEWHVECCRLEVIQQGVAMLLNLKVGEIPDGQLREVLGQLDDEFARAPKRIQAMQARLQATKQWAQDMFPHLQVRELPRLVNCACNKQHPQTE